MVVREYQHFTFIQLSSQIRVDLAMFSRSVAYEHGGSNKKCTII